MKPTALLALLLSLFAPALAAAQQALPPSQGTRADPFFHLVLALMAAVLLAWGLRVLTRGRRPPPLDPRHRV